MSPRIRLTGQEPEGWRKLWEKPSVKEIPKSWMQLLNK
jgi:hypothetical protein